MKRSDTEKEGYIEELKDMVIRNRLRVTFLGPKYGLDLRTEYRNADIFIYTSLWENFGQTILEAAASGLPIIASNVGVAPELVSKSYIVGANDSVEIADRILKLQNIKLRHKVRDKLLERVKRDFNWDKISEKYYKLYRKVVTTK